MIELLENSKEYLVRIPAAEKERAKRIQGRMWDPQRVCWYYPKTKRIYDELIAEFGDDLTEVTITPPVVGSAPKDSMQYTQRTSNILQTEFDKLRQSIEQMSASSNNKNSFPKKLQEKFISISQELAETKTKLKSSKEELSEVQGDLEDAHSQISNLRNLLQETKSSTSNFEDLVKEEAKESASNNPRFCAFLDKTAINQQFLNDLTNQIKQELERLLGVEEQYGTLYDLINQAADSGELAREAIDLAHLIRKERNKVIHGETYAKTHKSRILLSLFASALLWTHFPE